MNYYRNLVKNNKEIYKKEAQILIIIYKEAQLAYKKGKHKSWS